ncbi:hypothetical protein [Aurantiacibacter sediminis]|uniref:Uncharacterized protein n=1 Tax=Aurantiacibacter sediminis TaxID=2793064 RepID=A0ABS0N388_9SPHN|nr:hypothetical protein [Aurantiacibacter sediminis]MBH5322182.1 hypothetical protein [Aurantiacibacter sediminis]
MADPVRSKEEYDAELASLDAAHNQNEAQRDSFIGLAHTALFAASISFVADLFPLGSAALLWLVVMAWLSSCFGLLALTLSFVESRKAIDARRQALNDEEPPRASWLEALNAVALWTFPVSLLSIFVFASVNLMRANDQETFPEFATETTRPWDIRGFTVAA